MFWSSLGANTNPIAVQTSLWYPTGGLIVTSASFRASSYAVSQKANPEWLQQVFEFGLNGRLNLIRQSEAFWLPRLRHIHRIRVNYCVRKVSIHGREPSLPLVTQNLVSACEKQLSKCRLWVCTWIASLYS